MAVRAPTVFGDRAPERAPVRTAALRALAVGVALAVNTAILWGLVGGFGTRRGDPYVSTVIDLVVETSRSQSTPGSALGPAPDPAPQTNAQSEPQPSARAAEIPMAVNAESAIQDPPRPAEPPSVTLSAPAPRVQVDAALDQVQTPERWASSTQSVVRSVLCLQRPPDRTSGPPCSDGAPFRLIVAAGTDAEAQVSARVLARHEAMGLAFGYRPVALRPFDPLSPTPSVLGGSSRSFAASDAIRDRLGPSTPDPAFGD